MHSSQDIIAIIDYIKSAPNEKRLRAYDEIMPVIKTILLNTEIFKEIICAFNKADSENISGHIKAIKLRSENSADKIIDAASEISQNISSVSENQRKIIENSINQIYEGCNFQDLVSQHAKEINQIISHLSAEMLYIEKIIKEPLEAENITRPVQKERENQHLVNGPTTDFVTQSD